MTSSDGGKLTHGDGTSTHPKRLAEIAAQSITAPVYRRRSFVRGCREGSATKMAAFSLNSLPVPPSKHQKAADCSHVNGVLKPIVVTGNPPTFVSAPGRRIVAVGDLHGDLAQTRCALELAGVLSPDGQDLWIGGETILVQLGDILDRGEDEIAILSLLRSLNIQAKSDGGAVFQRQKGIIARSTLLRPGGPLACELAQHAVVLKVDDWIFCHGGLLPHHVAYGIERMNKEVSHWMQGFSEDDDYSPEIPFIATRGYDSVVWNRLYSRDSADRKYQSWQISSIVEEALQAVGAKGMVVGHTPQFNGVNCRYNQRIWCIDVGMSSGVLNSRPEVLEIKDNKARVLRNQSYLFDELEVMDYL
ncbi:shewanella-like protein phosphatase 1 isoform X2 [Phoenix dactylifera]|uniref:Shewanella-like protein phosphatase 1 isoform X2 n=1 Tax=Phoenix dactylifera TaxID=42345 RepID=A0A8B9A2M6_PHODC|nr:shewanella-like protein phosphatase 1 isoform X2 [Phoenix dactylifera]